MLNYITAMKTSGNFFINDTSNLLLNNIEEGINDNVQFLLVPGGGNGNRGNEMDSSILKSIRDTLGMIYTFKNALLLYNKLKSRGIDNIVLASNMSNLNNYFDIMNEYDIDTEIIREILYNGYIDITPNMLQDNLRKGNNIIVGGGSGYIGLTTDGAVSLIAGNANINTIIKVLTDYDCAYDKNPSLYKDAKPIKRISYDMAMRKNIKAVDSNSVYSLLSDRNQTLRIAGVNNSINSILKYEDEIGTTIRKNVSRTLYRR